MYDTVITLLGPQTVTYDAAGNEVITYQQTDIFALPRTVYSSEFYQAAQAGMHPTITFEIANRADYAGQKRLIWDGKTYNVIRADWTAQRDALRLICEEQIGLVD